MLLPVGGFRKSQIRQIAADLGLRVADKRDSQEICFVTSGRHAEFVRQRRPGTETDGQIVTTAGDVVGQHEGIEGFTIGQRKGLGVAMGEPYYVIAIEPDSNRVVIGHQQELARSELIAGQANWLVAAPTKPTPCLAQIRYNSKAQPATLFPTESGRFRVEFEQPCFGVAPGQAVVCYAKDRVLGGGWIVS
jgi:tRNA-specific 2-thiouridylase